MLVNYQHFQLKTRGIGFSQVRFFSIRKNSPKDFSINGFVTLCTFSVRFFAVH